MTAKETTPNRVSFTRSRIDRFTCPEGKSEVFMWDTQQTGLGVRVFASGKKSFIFRATVNGETKRGVIGDAGGDLEEARKEARRLLTLAQSGVSPTKDKAQRKQALKAAEIAEARGTATLQGVWQAYIEANLQGWGKHHLKAHLQAMQEPNLPCGRGLKMRTKAGALWSIREAKLSDINASTLERWLSSESKERPGIAALAYRMLFACFSWCNSVPAYSGLVNIAELKSRQLKKSVPKMGSREDVLEREQLAAWFAAIRQTSNPVISAFAQSLLLTGARRGELEGLKWEDVDLQWYSLTIRDKATTVGQDIGTRVIPLTPYVAQLLNALPRRNEWVFSSPTSENGRLKEPRRAMDHANAVAGIEGLTIHGLRRSFATLSEWVEVPAGITAQIMGHKPSAIAEKHYKRRPLDLLRKWHDQIEKWILEQAGIEQPAREQARLKLVEGVK